MITAMFTRARDDLLSVPQPYYTSEVYVGPHWRPQLQDVHLRLQCRHYYRGSERKWYEKFYLTKNGVDYVHHFTDPPTDFKDLNYIHGFDTVKEAEGWLRRHYFKKQQKQGTTPIKPQAAG